MRKVLIVSYYWPPAGGSGVQRWLKFAKYLPSNDWQPIIYTPDNPYLEIKDDKLLNNIPLEAEIWKTAIWEPYSLKDRLLGKDIKTQSAGVVSNKKLIRNRLLNWVRGNLFIPDPKIYWVKPSVKYLANKIIEHNIEHIITTGPPHSMHLIGLHLKKIYPDLKWIADFRDPWSELDLLDDFHLLDYSRKKHQQLEKEVLQNADVCLTVSENWVSDLKRLGGNRVELITNGYDDEDFNNQPKTNDKFIIGHYGLLNHLRNPLKLWKSLNSLCKKHTNFNNKLEIHLSGNIDGEVITDINRYPYLQGKVVELGYLSHAEVLKQYNEASILLLLLFNSKSGVGNYPGKMFEYFAAKKPILAFGPVDSDTQNMISKTNTGFYYDYMQDTDLQSNILNIFKDISEFKPSNKIINFTRKKLTQDLSNLLHSIN